MTRLLRCATLSIALLVAAAIEVPEAAHATSFAPMSIDQFTDAATYIVEGKVSSVWTNLDPKTGLVWTNARVSLTDVWKGRIGRPRSW